MDILLSKDFPLKTSCIIRWNMANGVFKTVSSNENSNNLNGVMKAVFLILHFPFRIWQKSL